MTCGKCIMIKILSYIYLPFMKKQCFGKKVFFYCYLKKQEKNHWWSFQVDELIPTRFVTEDIAFKVIMVMLNLLLQKPLWKSKSKVHISELERRVNLWEPWELLELLEEAETFQKCLKTTNTISTINEILKKFNRGMRGVRKAIKLLTDNIKNVSFL